MVLDQGFIFYIHDFMRKLPANGVGAADEALPVAENQHADDGAVSRLVERTGIGVILLQS